MLNKNTHSLPLSPTHANIFPGNNEQGLPSLAVLPKTRVEEIQLHTLATLPGSTLVLFSFSEHPVQAKACPGLWAIAAALLMSAQAWNSLIKALSL